MNSRCLLIALLCAGICSACEPGAPIPDEEVFTDTLVVSTTTDSLQTTNLGDNASELPPADVPVTIDQPATAINSSGATRINDYPQSASEIVMPLPSSTEDTIVVMLDPMEGWGPFAPSMSMTSGFPAKGETELDPSQDLGDSPWRNVYEKVSGIPDTLQNVRIVQEALQLEQAVYHAYKTGLMDSAFAMTWNGGAIPTYLSSAFIDQWASILVAEDKQGRTIIIYDTDNDEDFTAETAHVFPDVWRKQKRESAKPWEEMPGQWVSFDFFDGSVIQSGSAFLKIDPFYFPKRPENMVAGPAQYRLGEVATGGHAYTIALSNSNYSGVYNGLTKKRVKLMFADSESSGFKKEQDNGTTYGIHENLILAGDTFHVADVTMRGDAVILVRGAFKQTDKAPPYRGQPIRDFEAVTLAGDSLRLSDVLASSDKYILLDFWGSWCPPCIDELPALKKIVTQYDEQLQVIGIAMDEKESLASAVREYEISWPQIHQASMVDPIIKKYHVYGFPSYFLIDSEGTIIHLGQELRGEQLPATLEVVLGGNR